MKKTMRTMFGSALSMFALVSVVSFGALAASKNDAKTKDANHAHSNAPAVAPATAPSTTGAPATGAIATGENLQGAMTPEMTKWITEMKKCHKDGKSDLRCHDRAVKNCEAKLTKDECSKLSASVASDKASKM